MVRLLEEREVGEDLPLRFDDQAAPAPVAQPLPMNEGAAILHQLREQAQVANVRAAEAEAKATHASETLAAVTEEAKVRIAQVTQERDAALTVATEKQSERKQAAAVTAAVTVGLFQKLASEVAKIVSWVPALGSLFGGWWLFNNTVSNPAPMTLFALGLYAAGVIGPATYLTIKGKG